MTTQLVAILPSFQKEKKKKKPCIWSIYAIYVLNHVESCADHGDTNKYAKLFIGSVPRTATEEDVSYYPSFVLSLYLLPLSSPYLSCWF